MTERNAEPTDGGSIVAQVLRRHGVEELFTLCGGHVSPILVAAKAAGIRVVDCRDERSAVFAADASARLRGRVGVAVVTAGPGVTNAVTALQNARMAETPLLLLGGATGTLLKGRGALQDVDQLAMMRPLVKWAVGLRRRASIAPVLQEALDRARAGVPGPVFVELPVDLLYPERIVVEQYLRDSGLQHAKGPMGKALRWALRAYLTQLLHGPPTPRPSDPLGRARRRRWQPHPDEVATVARWLLQAERPVLLLGSQTMVLQRAPQTLAEAVRAVGAPAYLAGMARGLLGVGDPIQLRHRRSDALREADFVLVCGFPFDFRLKYGRAIGRSARVVAVGLDEAALRRNRKPDLAVVAHPAVFLQRLAEALPKPSEPRWAPWFERLRARERQRDEQIERMASEACEGGINPLRLCQAIERAMADDAVVVADGGDFVATASYIVRPRGPLRWLDPGVFGTLGVGGGFALAAALCYPSSEVWLLWGDGSCAYSLAEFDTCVRHGLAPIAVVGNDACWMQIAREQVPMLGDPVGTELRRTDYHRVAEGYGGKGLLLRSEDEIEDILREAKRLAAAGHPVLVNAWIGRTAFRKGSISM